MIAVKIAAFVAIMLCVLGLEYGGSGYTNGTQQWTQESTMGFIDLWIKDTQTINIPVLIGVGAITIGGALLFLGTRRSRRSPFA
jgi:hypothetical protein